ncbi:amino acid adenylation domain-containing protein [Amycolatopsis sp. GM8]|uniref:amino acid adenylation domain-containing protein n=1 Tax=Amycolatopsis sp. GM8 TaxID=2896530 RepID=UPI001F286AEA|nr:amino acid adenylation domain-containing protein [Amycolatopsis sp. GM8]
MDDARSLVPPLRPLPISTAEARAAARLRLHREHEIDVSITVSGTVGRFAREAPDRLAITGPGRSITYAELAERVAATREFLDGHGCGQGAVVAVSGPRSAESIIILLALESAGAVYLPVDRAWPRARLTTVLRRAGVTHLLHHHPADAAGTLTVAAAETGIPVLVQSTSSPAGPSRERCEDSGEPRYVFYTSGTTGTPKGALIEHRGMINHLWAKIIDIGLGPDDVVAFTAPLTFDIAIWQMLTPLLLGGCVAVLGEQDTSFPRVLVNRLRELEVSTLELVPTMLAWLADGPAASGGLPRLRHILSTGEELSRQLAARLLDAVPGVRVLNAYGFTETSDDVTHHVVGDADLAGGRLPVGSVVINTSLYVLVDEAGHWRAARPGEPGELFVGGLAPGCGYLNDEPATGKSFFLDVLDPDSPTGRLYRSGDGVVAEGSVLRYLGRLDRQVKVAGVRMELGEIEAELRRHPAVADCAVIATGDSDSDRREVAAYYVPAGSEIAVDQLRDFLAGALPPAMVPRRWHALTTLPVSANGKTDYRALAGD